MNDAEHPPSLSVTTRRGAGWRRIVLTGTAAGLALLRTDDLPEPLRPMARPLFAGAAAGFVALVGRHVVDDFGLDPRSRAGRALRAALVGGTFLGELALHDVEDRFEGSLDGVFARFPRLGSALLMAGATWAFTADIELPTEVDWEMSLPVFEEAPLPEGFRSLLLALTGDEPDSDALRVQLEGATAMLGHPAAMPGGELVLGDVAHRIHPLFQTWPVHARWESGGVQFTLSLQIVEGRVHGWSVEQSDGDIVVPAMPRLEQVTIVHDRELQAGYPADSVQ